MTSCAPTRGTRCGSAGGVMRRGSSAFLVVLALVFGACKEEGTIRVHSLKFQGVKAVDDSRLKTALAPRDRQLVVATHEMALNELRDHGFPHAKVGTNEDDGPNGKSASLTFDAEPGPIAHFGPVEISGNKSVSDRVIRRELAYKPGDLYQRSLIQDTQRRLYGMELFQFATVTPLTGEQQQQP